MRIQCLSSLSSNSSDFFASLERILPSEEHAVHLSVFGLVVGFLYLADRTHIFLKEQKQFNPWTFAMLSIAALLLGFVSVKKSDRDLGFLNREQTDEWKGWMQCT